MAGDNNGLVFITENDRRIYDLQQQDALLLSDFLAVDRPGQISAMRIAVQQIVNAVNSNLVFIRFYAGTVNPDNAFGADGDGYFLIPADGSKLQMFQRIDGIWLSVFNLPLTVTPVQTLTFDQTNLVEESYGGSWYLPVDLNGRDIFSIKTTAAGSTASTYIDNSLITTDSSTDPDSRISGFPSNDPQTITIKTL